MKPHNPPRATRCMAWILSFLFLGIFPTTVWAMGSGEEATMQVDPVVRLMFNLGVIFIAANVGGYLFRRFLKLPGVVGEVIIGILIGPYALGSLVWPHFGPLFPVVPGTIPIATELYGIAMFASILLLFMSGLETDVALFLRYSFKGTVVGIGGIVFAFAFGAEAAIFFNLTDSWTTPTALFLGAISTATSVGITARILSDHRKMDSPEGVTILSAAVLDDVLCIILLTVVTGITKVELAGGSVNWAHIGVIAAKGIGFWLALTAIGLLSAKRIASMVKVVRSPGTIAYISLGIALLMAGISEMAGLAMIIGAYITGLALSQTDLVDLLQNKLHNIYHAFVPIFFCVMGMLVDLSAMRGILLFGLVYSILAILAKVLGCGLAAWLTGFNGRGSMRIGFGMLPRGEVALIVAGIGLASGAVPKPVFGAAIMMTLITTLMAPPVLNILLKGPSGLRKADARVDDTTSEIQLELPSYDFAEFLLSRLAKSFKNEEFFVYHLPIDALSYRIRKNDLSFTITQEGNKLILTVQEKSSKVARYMLHEELLALQDLFEGSSQIKNIEEIHRSLLTG